MDPLSLITAIGGIAATGFKIAKAINDVVEELGTAGAQVKAVATDMRTVAVVLHELKIRLSRAKHVLTPEVAQVAHEIVELCKADIEDIEQSLSPLLAPEGEAMDLKRATKWLFTKSKIATKRASLDSLKLTLGLYMHTLQFIEGNYVECAMQPRPGTLVTLLIRSSQGVHSGRGRQHDVGIQEYKDKVPQRRATRADGRAAVCCRTER